MNTCNSCNFPSWLIIQYWGGNTAVSRNCFQHQPLGSGSSEQHFSFLGAPLPNLLESRAVLAHDSTLFFWSRLSGSPWVQYGFKDNSVVLWFMSRVSLGSEAWWSVCSIPKNQPQATVCVCQHFTSCCSSILGLAVWCSKLIVTCHTGTPRNFGSSSGCFDSHPVSCQCSWGDSIGWLFWTSTIHMRLWWNSWLLDSAWTSPRCCSYLESEPAGIKFLYPFKIN